MYRINIYVHDFNLPQWTIRTKDINTAKARALELVMAHGKDCHAEVVHELTLTLMASYQGMNNDSIIENNLLTESSNAI